MEELRRRRIGRPPRSGPEAEANPFSALSQEERRGLFLQTAARLFESKGYASTSVEDITRELGFTKGIFYYYWKNKEEIVQEIHDRALRIMHGRLDRAMTEERPPEKRLEAAIRTHVEAVMQNKSILAVLLGDFAFSEGTLEGRREYTRRFQDLVEDGIAAGAVRDDLDSRMLTFAILGLCNSVAEWYSPSGRLKPEDIENIYASFAAGGYATRLRSATDDLPEADEPG